MAGRDGRAALRILTMIAATALAHQALAQTAKTFAKSAAGKPTAAESKADPKAKAKADTKNKAESSAAAGKATPVANFDNWSVFTAASGKARTCYALSQAKDRKPAALTRDPSYVFISSRPGENVKNEVSIVMGYDVKADAAPKAEIGSASFDMIAKGADLWVKNPAEESQFVDALRRGATMIVKASSKKGSATVDTYPLKGLSPALERTARECS